MKVYETVRGELVIESTYTGENCNTPEAILAAAEFFQSRHSVQTRLAEFAIRDGANYERAANEVAATNSLKRLHWLFDVAKRANGGNAPTRARPLVSRFAAGVITIVGPWRMRAPRQAPASLRGYASVFFSYSREGTEFQLGDRLVERIGPTAFNRALSERHDVRALGNHDVRDLLARTKAGTLKLRTDSTGLWYECSLPSSPIGEQVAEALRRGDLSGSSFAFRCTKQRLIRATTPNGNDIREIMDLDLLDVSPVTFPAYEAATASLA